MALAFSSLLRRASHFHVPLAIRAVGSLRVIDESLRVIESAISTADGGMFRRSIHSEPIGSDELFLQQVRDEIRIISRLEHWTDFCSKLEVPEGPNSEIDNYPQEGSVLMKWEDSGEKIEVKVGPPYRVKNCYGDSDDSETESEIDASPFESTYMLETWSPITMTATKENGLCLEFKFTVSGLHIISFDSLAIKENKKGDSENQIEYRLLDSMRSPNLNLYFKYFLNGKIFGHGRSLPELYEHMQLNKHRDHLEVLRKLRKFLES